MSETEVETSDVPEQGTDEPATTPEPEEGEEQEERLAKPEETAEAPEEHGRTERELEQIRKKLDQSATTWRNRVSDLLGEDAQALTVCELCGDDIPGFHWPAEVAVAQNETQKRLYDVLLNPNVREFRDDPNTQTCTVCGGVGKTKTRGYVPNHELKTCDHCKGYGYLPPPGQSANGQVAPQAQPVAPGEEGEPLSQEDADLFGHPRLLDTGLPNPNYGRMPQFIDPMYP